MDDDAEHFEDTEEYNQLCDEQAREYQARLLEYRCEEGARWDEWIDPLAGSTYDNWKEKE